MAKGEFDERITFRKNDYFQEIAANFNDMAQTLEERVKAEGNMISEMSNKVDEIVEQMDIADFDREATMLSLQELRNIIDKCQQMIREDRGY